MARRRQPLPGAGGAGRAAGLPGARMSAALACLATALVTWPARSRWPSPSAARRWALRPAVHRAPTGPLLLAAVTGGVATVLATPVVGVLAAVCGAAAGRLLRRRTAASAERRRSRALVEALGVLAAEVRAGRPLADATGAAVDGCPDPG